MRRPVKITTPIPTVEQVARIMGVSRRRMKELVKLADELVERAEQRKQHASRRAARSKSASRSRAR